jgi:hypothetical protein
MGLWNYPNDIVICLQHDPEKTMNLKLFLCMFEMMSGLKINYLKSEFITIGGDNDVMTFYADMFNCKVGKLPMKYLGGACKSNLETIDWDFLDAKLIKKNWIPRCVILRHPVLG